MKWIVLVIAAALLVPASRWMRQNWQAMPRVWMLLGVLPFAISASPLLDIAIIPMPDWPGVAKGLEISLVDLLALAIYFTLPAARRPLPFRWVMLFYLVAVAASALQTSVPMAAISYTWQILRMFLLFVVVARGVEVDEQVGMALLKGMILGLCFQCIVALYQRFGLGVVQAAGTLPHRNYLGIMVHFVLYPSFAMVLAGERGRQFLAGALAGPLTMILTVSRAGIGFAAMGLGMLFLMSAVRRWTPRKIIVLMVGGLGAAVLVPFAIASLDERFAETPVPDDYDERAAFERAASMISADHPFGVGANNYVVVANTGGYLERAGVIPTVGSRSAPVHNAYWLTAAETGYAGVTAFIMLFVVPVLVAFKYGWRNRRDRSGDLLFGLGTSVLIVGLHAMYEWVLLTSNIEYLFAIDVGMIAGLALRLGYGQRRRPNKNSAMSAFRPLP